MNRYSGLWFRTFLDTVPREVTDLEVTALRARLPIPRSRRVLDLCCGPGRHAGALSRAGYAVTGVDRSVGALRDAARTAPDATFVALDMRHLDALSTTAFDAVLLLWQSFGYFSPSENDAVLGCISNMLRPGGLLLIDLAHPEWYRSRIGRAPSDREGVAWTETAFAGERLISTIGYADGTREAFDFEMFTPTQLAARAGTVGFEMVEACHWWDPARPADGSEARYQATLLRIR